MRTRRKRRRPYGVILVVAVIVNVRLSKLELRTAFSRFGLAQHDDEAGAAPVARAEGP